MRDLESSKELVKEIAKKERIIYDRIYSDLRSKKPLPDNPCKSFVL
jgi:hypothetical protein